MVSEKACRVCRYVSVGAEACPACGASDLTEQWAGFAIITSVENSELGKMLGVKMTGKYAIKIK